MGNFSYYVQTFVEPLEHVPRTKWDDIPYFAWRKVRKYFPNFQSALNYAFTQVGLNYGVTISKERLWKV